MKISNIALVIIVLVGAGCAKTPEDSSTTGDPYQAAYVKECKNDDQGGGFTAAKCQCMYEKISAVVTYDQFKEEIKEIKKAQQSDSIDVMMALAKRPFASISYDATQQCSTR